jgi:AraC-like DNA-binding protein
VGTSGQMSDERTPLGRPLIEIDMEKLKSLMQLSPNREEAASVMGCSVDTLERRIKESAGLTFSEFKEMHFAPTKMSLKQLALKLAKEGNETMLMYLLRATTDWTDRGQSQVQVNVQNNVNQSVTIEAVDLEDRIKQIKGET